MKLQTITLVTGSNLNNMLKEIGIESLDLSKSEHYTLSIRLSTGGFCFYIYNPLDDSFSLIEERGIEPSLSLTANLRRILGKTNYLKYKFKKINILLTESRYTLIPLELFDDKYSSDVFYYNQVPVENELVRYTVLMNSNTVAVYGVDKSAYQFLETLFPDANYVSYVVPLLEYFSTKSRLGNTNKVYAHWASGVLTVFCYEKGKLVLVNSFHAKVIADCVYYVLYVWKQLSFNQLRDELHLCGDLLQKEKLTATFKKYVSEVYIMNPFENLDLQKISVCE